MSEPSRPSLDDDANSFWADREPEPESVRRAWLHSRVFGLGVLTMTGTILGLAGLTWAGSNAASERVTPAQAAAAKAAPAGACTFTVDERSIPVEAVRARSLTMIAAVGHQVAAPDVQIARVIDVAMNAQGNGSTKVVDALALLAREDADQPSKTGLAQLEALARPGALTCRYTPTKLPVEQKGALGLTKRADKMRLAVLDAFGKLPTSGYTKPVAKPVAKPKSKPAPKAAKTSKPAKPAAPVATKATAATPAEEGRVVDVRIAPAEGVLDDAARGRGWLLAHWLVARGEVYKLDSVAFDDHTWSAASAAGWQKLPVDAATRHSDGVHITVQRGG